ncbi:MAG: primosomal protein N' [Gemmatimonadales bacterium]|nr:MAG: primosomal protein N' [Gemmatimonadales bacterium]
MDHHVEVALPLPLFQSFTYRIEEPPAPGSRVLVPFRRGERVGWVLGPGDPHGIRGIRPVLDVLDVEPSIPSDLLRLARWIAEYYVAPLGLVLRSMLPSVLSDRSRDLLRPLSPEDPSTFHGTLPGRSRRVLEGLRSRAGPARVSSLRNELGMGSIWPEIRRLRSLGLVEHWTEPPPGPPVRTRKVVRLQTWLADLAERERTFGRADRQRECFELLIERGGSAPLAALQSDDGFSRSVIGGLEAKGLVEVADDEVLRDPFSGSGGEPGPAFRPVPTEAQTRVLEHLLGSLDVPTPAPVLLRGVTGSGKTLVYLSLLDEVVARRGRSAIVLVPEISLTPQTVSRFRSWFGDQVAVLHSALSDGERFDQWRQIRSGERRIVVGARSALFAPLRDLGAIVVDEEHDGSYKQSETPRYHARDVAVVRAAMTGAICLLGSATPSLESWRNAQRKKFTLLTLPERVGGRPLPPVEVVDLRTSGGGKGPGTGKPSAGGTGGRAPDILTPLLVEAVEERLDRGEQSILLLNRRGYSSFIQCRACGEVKQCPHCSVSLTFHRRKNRLVCHHCRHEEAVPGRCPACGDPDLSYRGLGTEQVERVVAETFPRARIARMDVDTTGGKWSHAEILDRVGRGEVDILLGTQMIAKGLDFPRVTLVGVVNADVGLHLPDFRASERTFQLLSQVAGRAGRGDLGGRVLIQTAVPDHYAVRAALEHDYPGFARREMDERAAPRYPPGLRMVNFVVSSPDPEAAAAGAEQCLRWLERRRGGLGPGAELVGPAPAPIERLHGRWRWHFFLRGGGVAAVTRSLHDLAADPPLPPGDVRLVVDRDPVALL